MRAHSDADVIDVRPALVAERAHDAPGDYVYFVHSYYEQPDDPATVAATSDYGIEFCAAVWQDNVMATQFHPEKSQAVGLKMLKNFGEL